MFSNSCKFNRTCKKKDSTECNSNCYPYVLLHGKGGAGGFYGATGVPKRYRNNLIGTLPIKEENKAVYEAVVRYVANIGTNVEERGLGLFLYSKHSPTNPLGTGNGKTTTATTILNEYVIYATKKHLSGGTELKSNPALYVRVAEFQNKYNAQFRGGFDLQQESSEYFYKYKKRMKQVPLLVLDDIAVRDTTEAFKNELYEIIDYRATESLATIYTSNFPVDKLTTFLGERIVSRIDGMCYGMAFTGADHRKGDLF